MWLGVGLALCVCELNPSESTVCVWVSLWVCVSVCVSLFLCECVQLYPSSWFCAERHTEESFRTSPKGFDLAPTQNTHSSDTGCASTTHNMDFSSCCKCPTSVVVIVVTCFLHGIGGVSEFLTTNGRDMTHKVTLSVKANLYGDYYTSLFVSYFFIRKLFLFLSIVFFFLCSKIFAKNWPKQGGYRRIFWKMQVGKIWGGTLPTTGVPHELESCGAIWMDNVSLRKTLDGQVKT